MDIDRKRILISLPNQQNISGTMPLEQAKSIAEEQSLDTDEIISILVMDDKNSIISCVERNNGEWKEKKLKDLVFNISK